MVFCTSTQSPSKSRFLIYAFILKNSQQEHQISAGQLLAKEEQWDCRGLANQSAVFQISTNQRGRYGSRDFFGREGILGAWDRV